MNRKEVSAKLEEILRNVFNNNTLRINDDLTADQVQGWDSLTHVDLIISVEEAFNVKIPIVRAARLKNIGELIDVILDDI